MANRRVKLVRPGDEQTTWRGVGAYRTARPQRRVVARVVSNLKDTIMH